MKGKIKQAITPRQNNWRSLLEERTKELGESELKFRNIFENAIEGIYQSTPEGRFLRVNPALAQILGYGSPEEAVQSVRNIATDLYTDPERRKEFMSLIEKDGIVHNFEVEIRRKDGLIKYVSVNARSVKDRNGEMLYFEGTLQDITDKKLAVEQIILQRNLALKLAQIDTLKEGLDMILNSALLSSGMECAGILLKNSESGAFDRFFSIGLMKEFQEKLLQLPVESLLLARPFIIEKKCLHIRPRKDITPIAVDEGFKFISVVPILQRDEVNGFLITCSRVLTEISDHARVSLEFLGAELGSVIARMQTRQRLGQEIATRKEAEKALEAERHNLEEANTALIEANTALKVLLKHRDEDRREMEEKLLVNVQQLVMPYIEKLKRGTLDPVQQISIGFVESNLNDLISPFLKNVQRFKFTPRQLEVVLLIREGRTTKEIAHTLNMNQRAVEIQRFMVRKKLGLNKAKTNLQTHLKSIHA